MRIATVLFVALCLPLHAIAQELPDRIVVTGVGHASAPPDEASVNISISHTSRQTGVAMQEITETTENVLAAIRAYGVAEEEIETTGLSLSEEWKFEDDQRIFQGYEASTSVRVEVRDLAGIGNLISTISQNGGVEIRGPYFSLQDETALRNEARRNAVLDGAATARLLADAANVTLGTPLLITDGTDELHDLLDRSPQYEEPVMEEAIVLDSASTILENGIPVIPPDIETTQIVKLVYRIAQ